MTVSKNLRYGWKPQSNIDFEEVVDLLQLRHLLHRMPSQISGGERQRTALGRSLLSSPDILLLDEPFSAVDVSFRSQLLSLITRVHKKVKIPILVVSHNLKLKKKKMHEHCFCFQVRHQIDLPPHNKYISECMCLMYVCMERPLLI